ncbi:MAG: uroporphyrinogen-III synthase [Isosphaeraceae bacterium]
MSHSNETSPLAGLRVALFESRMAEAAAEMIRKQGGVPLSASAMKEIPLEDSPEVAAFADSLVAGGFEVVIFETGVGVRHLAQAVETRLPRETWLAALAKTRVVARGPKPAAVLRELKVRIDLHVPEPNTWHETLAALDSQLSVDGLRVAVQEYGRPNPELIDGLKSRGAIVTRVPLYRWALPDDLGPLRETIGEIAAGKVGAALFTTAQQVHHLLQVAAAEGLEVELRGACATQTIIASIGPTTSETLRSHGLPVDIEPEHSKLGHLIAALAARWRDTGKGRSSDQK